MQFVRSLFIAIFGIVCILFGLRDVSARGPGAASAVSEPKKDYSTTRSTHEAVTETKADGSLLTDESIAPGIGNSARIGRESGEVFPYSDTAPTSQSGRNTRMKAPAPAPRQSPTP